MTPEQVRDLTLKIRLWQTDVSMPVTARKKLMSYLDQLWPEYALQYEEWKRSGGVL